MSEVRVKVYAYLVHEGLKTIEEVPDKYREAVKKRLEEIEKEGF
ncbi:CD1375 family protein [Ezakiella peruensis]|nr:CD1375 family protein [Ezakiella peruensis]